VHVRIYCGNARVAATGMEALYRRARAAGAVIVKFDRKPVVSSRAGAAVIRCADAAAGADYSEEFDTVVIVNRRDRSGYAKLIEKIEGLRAGPEGELQYDNIWLLPGLTNRPGIFAAGAARGDTDFRAAVADGMAAANEIHALLAGNEIRRHADAAAVDPEKCVLCLTCLRVCPHGAITVDREKEAAFPSPVSCKRCGACAAECPAQAITLPGFEDKQVSLEIGARPGVVVFACENSAIPAAEAAAEAAGGAHGKNTKIIKVPCAGEVDPRLVLSALESGARRVVVLGCHPESCKFLSGSSRAERRMKRVADMLAKAGFDGSRVSFHGLASVQPGRFSELIKA
jgi:coenzyme F420-reducing hydrogenase delta subunit/NAD-dependent dihydropyrimidine dehydrogenase PreA subunit